MGEEDDKHVELISMICFGLMAFVAILLIFSVVSCVWSFFAS